MLFLDLLDAYASQSGTS